MTQVEPALKTLHDNESKNKNQDFDIHSAVSHAASKHQSRHEILGELESLGVDTDAFSSLPMENLSELLDSLQNLVRASSMHRRPGRPKNNGEYIPVLSEPDKKILRHLFSSNGYVSSLMLSRELGIPLSTVQRRRKRLESNLVERHYTLRVEKFGWRTATLFVSTTNGKTAIVGKDILDMSNTVTSVTRTLGENTIDIKVEVIFRTNHELLLLIDRIKSCDGVRNVFWSESVESIGRNSDCYRQVIDSS
ncbi:Lrp/AsnC family transcriptional regulator [Nitrososphaera sp.]|uniref:Lrp/AsnC family transcriptional regulator n=1 Tax=Nitrososphaera sp. TaxID=1971748 RepID=UPI00183E149C|nr:Lrp/AsnC family transcriptional regulator [Nitrososphaera sp.]NWG37564.1 Lrp/AsnC family transcriptional regulator [Nitrososphaera sp.]